MVSSQYKIVIFDGSFETTAFIRRLLKGLVKHHQVYVIGFNENLKNRVEGVNYIKIGSNQNKFSLIETSLKNQGLSLNLIKNIVLGDRKKLQLKNLDKILNKINPDVIHLQWPSVLPWLEPYLKKNTYSVILSQRGYHTNVRPFTNKVNFNYLKKWYPKLSGLHSVSEAVSLQGKKIGIPKTNLDRVVYTGLNLDDFDFNLSHKKDNILKIISVGRPHWKKGYSYAVRACKMLQLQGLEFKYTIVGATGDEELIYLIKEFNLEEKVILTDKLPQDQVFSLIKQSSLFLLPSLEEGIANVAVESMAIGIPVISTTCGGMSELIIDNYNGFLIPTRNEKAIITSITNFSNLKGSEIDKISSNARKTVEEKFTESKMVNNMLGLYQDVIALKSKI